jgi:hypothetical protein
MWAQTERVSRIPIAFPWYSSAAAVAGSARSRSLENPFLACVPSQNGLFADPPHRHRNTAALVGSCSPREFWRVGWFVKRLV